MTIQRIIELLEIEHECILRNSHGDCDRDCADCDLVQDDGDLHEMYTDVIAMLKIALLGEQEEKPLRCDKCSYHMEDGWCGMHGRWVKETDYCSFGAWEGQ